MTAYVLAAYKGALSVIGTVSPIRKFNVVRSSFGTSFSLMGANDHLIKTSLISPVSHAYIMTGTTAPLKEQHKLVTVPVIFAIVRPGSPLSVVRRIKSSTTAFTVTTTTAVLKKTAVGIRSNSGHFSLSGTSSKLVGTHRLTATPTAFVLTGTNNKEVERHKMTTVSRTYTLTGTASLIGKNHKVITTQSNSFIITGTIKLLREQHKIVTINPSEFILTRTPVVLNHNIPLVASTGHFVLTGTVDPLSYEDMKTVSGHFVLTGVVSNLSVYTPKVNKYQSVLDALPTNKRRIVLQATTREVVL